MRKRARLLLWVLGTMTFFFFFLFGAVAVDPLPIYRSIQETRLSFAGARREVFAADDGTTLSAFVLGPLSAERPVVLLHGLGADATYWTDTARFLARRGRTVILPDAPGSGRSDPPRDPAGYGLTGRLAALDALARALALEKLDLVGHSLGGWTVGWYALKFPWKAGRLVLVDAAGLSLPADAEAERARVLPTDRAGARRIFDLLFSASPRPRRVSFSMRSAGTTAEGPQPPRSPASPRPTAFSSTSASCRKERPCSGEHARRCFRSPSPG